MPDPSFPQWQQAQGGGYASPYQALIERKRAELEKPMVPMYSPEEVEARRNANDQQYALGMLGQLSGHEGLGNVGGQVLKQALAGRAQKITERGTTDQLSGQFTYDPDFLRQQQEAGLAGLEQKEAADRSRFDKDALDRQAKTELAQQRAEDQRVLRGMMADNKRGRDGAAQDDRKYKLEDSMADDFRKESTKPEQVKQAFNGLKATAQRTDAASDMAFIYQYMRMLDPTSVVREGEFATAQNAAGVPARILNLYNKARTGRILNEAQKKEFLGAADALNRNADKEIRGIAGRYHKNASTRGLDLNAVTPGYAPGDVGGGASPADIALDVGALLKPRNPQGAPRAQQALPLSNPKQPNKMVQGGF